jgi:hypothetical protein
MIVAIRPPTLTSGAITLVAGSAGPGWPDGTGGTTGPKPVAKMRTASPGRIGFDVDTGAPFFRTEKTPGSWDTSATFSGALSPDAVRTTASSELPSGSSKGIWTFTCVGETNSRGAATPPKKTRVELPGSSVGAGMPWTAAIVVVDRSAP